MTKDQVRVLVFTDTLADINGVCRFIQNIAQTAHDTNQHLKVMTSTRLVLPEVDNVINFTPSIAMKMPKYETLDLAIPPMIQMLRAAEEFKPDVIHISTPGPIGTVGMIASKLMRVPVVGVYHTDFPAYVDELFENRLCSWMCRMTMRVFYKQFRFVFSRSEDYKNRLVQLGIDQQKIAWLQPGFDNTRFDATLRDPNIWDSFNINRDSIKAIYCGRVSTEKNLPTLVNLWNDARTKAKEAGKELDLIIVGDGPYREEMEQELNGQGAHFLGFRHGKELATIYASTDFFVFPSTTDTLGQVVMESQASGLPVIVTDQGGPKEIVSDQHSNSPTAFVVPIEDEEQWIKKIVELATNDSMRSAMGRDGIEAMKNYTFTESFKHYWSVHEQATK